MSTRCNILLKDKSGAELWFYRHYDGYPDNIMPDLKRFMGWVKNGHLRDNVNQAGGWIIAMGLPPLDGHYEPTTEQHGDINWLYTLDLGAKTIEKEEIS